MEMLILLNGILIACNVHLLIKSARNAKPAPAPAKEKEKEKNAVAEQFVNMMAYDGTPQGGVTDED